MLLLVTKSLPEIKRIDHERLGILLQPRAMRDPQQIFDAGIPWAADNDFFQGYSTARIAAYCRMLGTIAGKPGALFVTCPDIVGNWPSTLILYDTWGPILRECGLPVAVVLQDGADQVPLSADAVFVGGTTEWKLSDQAHRLVDEAKDRGLWTHMGRVNSNRRLELAASWGIDSVDGSGWAKWFDTHIERGLKWAGSQQSALEGI